METRSHESKPTLNESFLPNTTDSEEHVRELLMSLTEFGIKFEHSPDLKTIWIKAKVDRIGSRKLLHITFRQGNTYIRYMGDSEYKMITLEKESEKKAIATSYIKNIEYREGTLYIEY